MSVKKVSSLLGLSLLSVATAGVAAPAPVTTAAPPQPTTEQRLQRLENILRNQSLSDIVLKLQRLQQEVQQLRGEVELQNHAVDALKKRQRDLYLDIDSRLSRLQPKPGAPAVPPTTQIPATSLSPPATQPVTTVPVVSSPPSMAPATQVTASIDTDPAKEEGDYQQAFNLLREGRYPESITAFRQFLDRYPGSRLADNAQYWLGEARYVTRDFDAAKGEFEKVLTDFPDSSKVPGAMLKLGFIHYEMKDWPKAKEVLESLESKYPVSTEARMAKKRLERMRLEKR